MSDIFFTPTLKGGKFPAKKIPNLLQPKKQNMYETIRNLRFGFGARKTK